MPGWRDLFTPIAELEEQEPQILELENLDGGLDEAYFERRGPCKADNPMALVEMIAQRKYNDNPREVERRIGNGIEQTYEIKLFIGRRTGTGISANKTDARHIAAYNLLLDVIENNEFAKFDLPGETCDEALEYVQSIQPPTMKDPSENKDDDTNKESQLLKQEEDTDPTSTVHSTNLPENWHGKCTQLCARHDLLTQPTIEYDEPEGPAHSRTFRCIISFPGLPDVIASATTKKIAKNWAYSIMYKELEKLPKGPKAGPRKEWGVPRPIEESQQLGESQGASDEIRNPLNESITVSKNEESKNDEANLQATENSTESQLGDEKSITSDLNSMSIAVSTN